MSRKAALWVTSRVSRWVLLAPLALAVGPPALVPTVGPVTLPALWVPTAAERTYGAPIQPGWSFGHRVEGMRMTTHRVQSWRAVASAAGQVIGGDVHDW